MPAIASIERCRPGSGGRLAGMRGSGHLAVMAAAALLLPGQAAAAGRASSGRPHLAASVEAASPEIRPVAASDDAARLLKWVVDSGDNLGLPFMIIDKVHATATAFHADGSRSGSSAALLGLGRGDVSPPGIGQRKLAQIPPAERITPAGRFLASLGNDLGAADVLWVDYDAGISLHRVITGNPKDKRRERLGTATADDNRISYGCINVPVGFFDGVVTPLFTRTNGVVYILPEARPLDAVFSLSGGRGGAQRAANTSDSSSSVRSTPMHSGRATR